jgi:hypothetical protein
MRKRSYDLLHWIPKWQAWSSNGCSWARCVSYCTESSIYTYHIMYATTEGNSPNFKLSSKSRQSAYRFRFQIHTMKHAILRIILTNQAKILCRLTADMQLHDRLIILLGVIAISCRVIESYVRPGLHLQSPV